MKPRRKWQCCSPSRPEPADWRVYLAVGLVALCAYLNGLGGEFVHDDIPAVVRNRDVVGAGPVLMQLLRDDFWGTPMHEPASHKSYRPLTTLSFRLNYLAAGLTPVWFHATNVALHAAACILVTRVGLAVASLRPGFAALTGLLFAAHPVHTDAVTGVVGRADVLACVLFLLSFLAYHGDRASAHVRSSVCLGALAMLAKETGVTVLLLNLLFDVWRSWPAARRSEGRWNEEARQLTRRAATTLVSLGALLVVRLALLHGTLPKFSPQDNPAAFHPCFHVRLLTFCYLAALNCWLLLCPATLSHDWQMGSVPLIATFSDSRNLATCLFLGGCVLLTYRAVTELERHPALTLGWLLLLLPFLPASNLLLTVGFVVAERVLYIPSVGWVLLVAYGAQTAWTTGGPRRRHLVAAGLALLLLTGCWRTAARNRDWASRESLLRAGLRALPGNAKLHYNLANFLRDDSQPARAVLHYQLALWLWPTYASAHNNLGTMTAGARAEHHFLAAIQAQPGHVNAHYNLGQLYRRSNRSEESARMLQRCVALDPAYAPAYLVLARLASGPASGALLRHAARLQPRNPDYLAEYAAWMEQRGAWLPALQLCLRGLRLAPAHRASLLGAARLLRSRGQWPRAHQLLSRWLLEAGRRRSRLAGGVSHGNKSARSSARCGQARKSALLLQNLLEPL